MSPMVIGKEAYYYYWGFFPMGFVVGNSDGMKSGGDNGYPNWMSPMFGSQANIIVAVDIGALVLTTGGSVLWRWILVHPCPQQWQCSVKHECDAATVGTSNFNWS
ncbi:unnamed protein product [Fraxinus pennsylvanica]|uniref:Uncharacterized protein n=1 Tax=Fraxinus pennsylvanica TaxID=56036 RepID=A0AAD2ADC2_9LAMI|nr:unnamed protein product [Fraxinus pennsylvanica]